MHAHTSTRALHQLNELAIGTEKHCLRIAILDRHKDSHQLPLARDYHGRVSTLPA
jgi:hypothetical protein